VNLAMVDAAQRDNEFIAHLPPHRTRLHEAEVMGIGVLSPANKTRLLGNEPQMCLVAMATRLRNRKNALVDAARRLNLRLDGRMWWCRRRF